MGTFVETCDSVIADIARYVHSDEIESPLAYETARIALADSLGCAALAHTAPECTRLLGPIVPEAGTMPAREGGVTADDNRSPSGSERRSTAVPGARVPGAHVPGVRGPLDPVTAAFNLGMLIRWLDYNDTWLAAEWGHPSDNVGAILSVADFLSRGGRLHSDRVGDRGAGRHFKIRDVLSAMIKAYEIQGVLALQTSLNRVGLDHVLLVKVASAAVAGKLLGANEDQIAEIVSNAFIDSGPLRTYRHFPNTGPRKSWAAGDATARGVQLALLVLRGEPGYPSALTAPLWGFQDAVMRGEEIRLHRPLGSYVMENILFKVAFPAEFHGQTAVEAAFALHSEVTNRLNDISRIVIKTQESGMRIINKTGPLFNSADRDHCIQYMVAVALIKGELTADDYRDNAAADPRIDALRNLTEVVEEPRFSTDYLDPEKRSIGNAVQVFFSDGSETREVPVEYPLGHRTRRAEARPLLYEKLERNLSNFYSPKRVAELMGLWQNESLLDNMAVEELTAHFEPE